MGETGESNINKLGTYTFIVGLTLTAIVKVYGYVFDFFLTLTYPRLRQLDREPSGIYSLAFRFFRHKGYFRQLHCIYAAFSREKN